MPVYEYQCPECGSQTSVLHKHLDRAQKTKIACKTCGHKPMRRVLSTFAFRPGAPSVSSPATATPEDSPQALAQTMRRTARGKALGDEFNEVAARLEKGESANRIEASLRKRKGQKPTPH